MIAQNIYSIYLYTGLHKRKVFDQIIHVMSKRINLSIDKHQIICNQSASAGVLDKVLDYGSRGPEFESSVGSENFKGKQMCLNIHMFTKRNMTLVNNFVYCNEKWKSSMDTSLIVQFSNICIMWSQKSGSNIMCTRYEHLSVWNIFELEFDFF